MRILVRKLDSYMHAYWGLSDSTVRELKKFFFAPVSVETLEMLVESRRTTVASDCPCGGEETYTGAFGLLLCKNCHRPSA